jgi:hypothetical protein
MPLRTRIAATVTGVMAAAILATAPPAQAARPTPLTSISAGTTTAGETEAATEAAPLAARKRIRLLHPMIKVGTKWGIPTVYVHYLWGDMWALYNVMRHHSEAHKDVVTALCGAMPTWPARGACAFFFRRGYNLMENKVNYGIQHKRCLAGRFPIPPAAIFITRIYTATCVS